MSSKKVLGRGLGALIPGAEETRRSSALMEVSIESIVANPNQPRRRFDDASIEELAASIREHGIVQPLIVTRNGDRYGLVAGERRLRAARSAGLSKVPVIVRELAGDDQILQVALIENIQREDLNPLEEAMAYQQLHQQFHLTQEEIARRVGKQRSTVANFLRLMKLSDHVRKLLAGGEISMGHARALLSADGARKQEQLADRVVRNNLNVRQTELLVAPSPRAKKAARPKDVFTRDAEEKLTRHLHSRVEINRKKRGGVIEIRFSDEDDLIRLFEELTGHGRKR